LTDAINAIDEFAARQPNWDGFGGRAPSEEAIADAKSFLRSLPSSLMPDHTFAPGDGEIAFQWRREQLFIEIGFFGDRTVSWFVRRPKETAHGDDVYDRANPRIPETLALVLSSILEAPVALLSLSVRSA
jgi:hypothetical protein